MSTVSRFVGRADDLQAVDNLLTQSSRVNIAAAVGMGGVGKTELALQYARRRGDAFPGGVCWLRGVEPIAPQIVSFAQEQLNLTVPEQTENPMAWCVRRWPNEGERNGPVLMVVDDVQDYGALKQMLPSDQRFRVLLTTRQAILPRGQRLALEVLVPEAALELLTSLVGAERIEAELTDAEALCEWVGWLPLGLELVGWYLARQRTDWTIAKLLERLKSNRLAAKALVDTHPEMTATLGVAAAFEASWEPLSTGAKTLAGLLGLFAAAPVDWIWVRRASEQMREATREVELSSSFLWVKQVFDRVRGVHANRTSNIKWLDEEALENAQAELLWVHLLQRQETQTGLRYQVHLLVRELFAVKLAELTNAEGLQQGFAQAMTEIAKTIPPTATLAVQKQVGEAVPHMEAVALHWTEHLEGIDKIWCCTGLARFYESLSQWKEAERYCKRSLTISKKQFGDCHPFTASSLNNLAALYYSQGRYSEAEPLYLQALDIRQTELGDHHPSTALSLNNLAVLYYSQGRYSEAEPLFVQALKIHQTALGDHHLDTAQYLNNLAKLYRSQRRYSKAEPLYEQALEINQTELGKRHPKTALSLSNLALLYQLQGRCSEAELLLVQALEISQTELGDRHPDTATSLLNLAVLYYQTRRHQQALAYIQQALEIYIPTLGINHPDTQAAMSWREAIQKAIDKSL